MIYIANFSTSNRSVTHYLTVPFGRQAVVTDPTRFAEVLSSLRRHGAVDAATLDPEQVFNGVAYAEAPIDMAAQKHNLNRSRFPIHLLPEQVVTAAVPEPEPTAAPAGRKDRSVVA